ncbi:MAG: hypothetical protein H6597_00855 [Flavobacteriales bacterium]|nr:hypothetical protein [Flavobacteriales bacterium]
MNSAADAGADAMTTVCDEARRSTCSRSWAAHADGGGSWTDPNGNAHTSTFDPSSDPAGIYTYTLAGRHRAPGDSEHGDRRCEQRSGRGHRCDDHGVRPGAAIDLFLGWAARRTAAAAGPT